MMLGKTFAVRLNESLMRVVRFDPFTGKENEMLLAITEDEWNNWQEGIPIQRAMPKLSADEREFLITGLTPSSWDKLFKSDEDKENNGNKEADGQEECAQD